MTIVSHFIPIHGTKQRSTPKAESLFDNELWMNVHDSLLGSRTTTEEGPRLVEFAQLTPEERKQLQSILNTYVQPTVDGGYSVNIARASDVQAINDKLGFDNKPGDTTTVAEKFAIVNDKADAAQKTANTADTRVTQLKSKVNGTINKSFVFENGSDKPVVGGQLNCQYHEDTQTLSLNVFANEVK